MRLSRVVKVGFLGGTPGRESPFGTCASWDIADGGKVDVSFCVELREVVDSERGVCGGWDCGCVPPPGEESPFCIVILNWSLSRSLVRFLFVFDVTGLLGGLIGRDLRLWRFI